MAEFSFSTNLITDSNTLYEFILKYKEFECLWKTTLPDYCNKEKRLACLRELLVIMKKSNPNADLYTVKRKINSIRSNFNKQHKRVMQKLQDSGDTGDEEYYEHTIRNYSLLKFLIEYKNPQKNEKQDPDKETIYLEEEYSNDETHEEYSMKDEPESTTPPSQTKEHILRLPSQSSKKRRLAEPKMSVESNYETEEAESTSYRPQYSSFGEHIAEKLRCMPNKMAIYCQKIINDAIFHAEIGDLNKTSRIVTDFDFP